MKMVMTVALSMMCLFVKMGGDYSNYSTALSDEYLENFQHDSQVKVKQIDVDIKDFIIDGFNEVDGCDPRERSGESSSSCCEIRNSGGSSNIYSSGLLNSDDDNFGNEIVRTDQPLICCSNPVSW